MTLRSRLVVGSLVTLAISLGAALFWIDRDTRLAFERQFDREVSRARSAVAARLRRDAEGLRSRLVALSRDKQISALASSDGPVGMKALDGVEELLASTALDTLWVLRACGGRAGTPCGDGLTGEPDPAAAPTRSPAAKARDGYEVLATAHAAADARIPPGVLRLLPAPGGGSASPDDFAILTEAVRRGGRLVRAPVITVALHRPGGLSLVAGRVLGKELAADLRLGATLPIEIGIRDERAESPWVSSTFDTEPPSGWRRVDIDLDGPNVGELTAAVFVSGAPLEERLGAVRSAGTVAGTLAAVLAIAMGFVLGHRLLRPLRALADAARAIALGGRRVSLVARRDEIGQVNTAFVAMAADLDASEQRLRQSERIAAWQELARELAHEIKNPLTPIQLAIETLQRTRETKPERFDEAFTECTATVLEEVERLKHIVSEFSQFARLPASVLQLGSLNDVVRKAAALQAEACPGTVELHLDPGADLVRLDPERMAQVVHNLVKNAVEATSAVATRPARIVVRTRPLGRLVAFEVEDNGEGLDDADSARIFAPYFTRRAGGTGLGLAVVSRIVAEHGGSVAVKSERGRGTTFTVSLPRPEVARGEG